MMMRIYSTVVALLFALGTVVVPGIHGVRCSCVNDSECVSGAHEHASGDAERDHSRHDSRHHSENCPICQLTAIPASLSHTHIHVVIICNIVAGNISGVTAPLTRTVVLRYAARAPPHHISVSAV